MLNNGVQKRIQYCLGNGFEFLSDSVVIAVCQDSNVANHAWFNGHSIDFNNVHVIAK